MRYAVLVCGPYTPSEHGNQADETLAGPAGAGKSTFASALITHGQTLGRTMHLFNLDPAAEDFEYEPAIGTPIFAHSAARSDSSEDIRDLISLEDVMEDLDLGPNGGLLYCFE